MNTNCDPADPILMESSPTRLLSITEEMGTNLIRASFSTNINWTNSKERRTVRLACSTTAAD
jgi:N-methylhydantoinase B/oxoprolinase/acetone carboxylase alpha subunit